ncbi:ribokinase [Nocardia otitidiscaviarum]|uniref:Ribokinase n=1 Tax=Nocardia otitidiscaviarum TaxID=1823 RepID=A0A516NHB1_9NOCA|nr:ribokinase [Nocardia otitidiscaviarum]MCP9623539.1 ribokinase [Nocardia otitidiscaviarum]QDP78293.1 ribokinase [Nocardia otitidiscaviarum]
MTVVVLGSVNRDVVCEVPRLPAPGETVLAVGTRTNLGGKGSNQAVAAAKAGGRVEFVARIGAEPDPSLRKSLREYGVGLEAMCEVPGAHTGTAYITVASGENQIVVDPAANFQWETDPELDAAAAARLIADADVVVAQLEVPVRVVDWAARRARRFILNAAPAAELPTDLLHRCDPLIVNETELATFTGATATTPPEAFDQARELCRGGVPAVVATLGAAGAVWVRRDGGTVVGGHQPAPRIHATDSTGAGDAFVGALATALARGDDLPAGVAFATAAAALAVQSPGTHSAYPGHEQITAALGTVPPAAQLP